MPFLIRAANFKDQKDLLNLARKFPLCSLPKHKKHLEKKLETSRKSFDKSLPPFERNYIFVLEDTKKSRVIGSSQILSYFGKNRSPCYRLQNKKSLKLIQIPSGRHQIGGLILDPDYRKSPLSLGLQIGTARFLYIKSFPKDFSPLIEVSLTAPVKKGRNHFWEETGAKYLKMNYSSALNHFQKNRLEFLSLFPKDLEIPLNKLSPKARSYMEQVHPQTLPVYKGLLKRGFSPCNHYHLLDGGLYLEALWKDLPFLKKSRAVVLKKDGMGGNLSFLTSCEKEGEFFCTLLKGRRKGNQLLLKSLPKNWEPENNFALEFPF